MNACLTNWIEQQQVIGIIRSQNQTLNRWFQATSVIASLGAAAYFTMEALESQSVSMWMSASVTLVSPYFAFCKTQTILYWTALGVSILPLVLNTQPTDALWTIPVLNALFAGYVSLETHGLDSDLTQLEAKKYHLKSA